MARSAFAVSSLRLPRALRATHAGACRALMAAGIDLRKRSGDRRVLETVILPWFARSPDFHSVLFAGCAWYTSAYGEWFADKRYRTIDPDPVQRAFGAANHLTSGLQHIAEHLEPGSLDLVICNGVFGWGLDRRAEVERAFDGCFEALREGGVLMLGWNDVARRRPFHPDTCRALQRFRRWTFPPLDTWRHLTATRNRHTFDFYRR